MPCREDLLGIAYVCVGGGRPISPCGAQYGLLARLCARYAVRIRRAFLMHNAAFFVHNLAPVGELLGIGITNSFLRREVRFRRLKYRL